MVTYTLLYYKRWNGVCKPKMKVSAFSKIEMSSLALLPGGVHEGGDINDEQEYRGQA